MSNAQRSQLGDGTLGTDRRPTAPATPANASASGRPPGLSSVWPEVLDTVAVEDRALAARVLRMPLLHSRNDDLSHLLGRHAPHVLNFLIVDGVALKRTTLLNQQALELLGPGDLLAPPPSAAHQLESRADTCYVGLGSVSLLVIDARFVDAAQRWPGLISVMHEHLAQQMHRASAHAAMLHLPRIEDRLVALFADFAERFGRVGTAGILLDLPLTHELIGRLVGSRRSTVSFGLKALADQRLIEHHDSARWTLSPSIVTL